MNNGAARRLRAKRMATNKEKYIAKAQKFLKRGQIPKAIAEYQRVWEIDPRDTRVCIKLGDLHLKNKDRTNSIKCYFAAAEVLTKDGFYSKAAALYHQMINIDESRIDLQKKLAETYFKLGLNAEAIEKYEIIAANYEREGKLSEAIETIEIIYDLDPYNIKNATRLAELYYKSGMKDEGYLAIRTVIDQFKKKGRIEQAVKLMEKVAKIDPGNHQNLKELAEAYQEHEHWEQAYQALVAALKTGSKNTETLERLAEISLKSGRTDKSIQALQKLYSVYSKRPEEKKKYMAALEKLETLVPTNFDYKKELADVYLEEQNWEAAYRILTRVQTKFPEDEQYLEKLAHAAMQVNRPHKSAQFLKKLSAIYFRKEMPEKAEECLEKVIEIFPDDPEALAILGKKPAPAPEEAGLEPAAVEEERETKARGPMPSPEREDEADEYFEEEYEERPRPSSRRREPVEEEFIYKDGRRRRRDYPPPPRRREYDYDDDYDDYGERDDYGPPRRAERYPQAPRYRARPARTAPDEPAYGPRREEPEGEFVIKPTDYAEAVEVIVDEAAIAPPEKPEPLAEPAEKEPAGLPPQEPPLALEKPAEEEDIKAEPLSPQALINHLSQARVYLAFARDNGPFGQIMIDVNGQGKSISSSSSLERGLLEAGINRRAIGDLEDAISEILEPEEISSIKALLKKLLASEKGTSLFEKLTEGMAAAKAGLAEAQTTGPPLPETSEEAAPPPAETTPAPQTAEEGESSAAGEMIPQDNDLDDFFDDFLNAYHVEPEKIQPAPLEANEEKEEKPKAEDFSFPVEDDIESFFDEFLESYSESKVSLPQERDIDKFLSDFYGKYKTGSNGDVSETSNPGISTGELLKDAAKADVEDKEIEAWLAEVEKEMEAETRAMEKPGAAGAGALSSESPVRESAANEGPDDDEDDDDPGDSSWHDDWPEEEGPEEDVVIIYPESSASPRAPIEAEVGGDETGDAVEEIEALPISSKARESREPKFDDEDMAVEVIEVMAGPIEEEELISPEDIFTGGEVYEIESEDSELPEDEIEVVRRAVAPGGTPKSVFPPLEVEEEEIDSDEENGEEDDDDDDDEEILLDESDDEDEPGGPAAEDCQIEPEDAEIIEEEEEEKTAARTEQEERKKASLAREAAYADKVDFELAGGDHSHDDEEEAEAGPAADDDDWDDEDEEDDLEAVEDAIEDEMEADEGNGSGKGEAASDYASDVNFEFSDDSDYEDEDEISAAGVKR